MATKKTTKKAPAKKAELEFWQPGCEFTLRGKVYKCGDPVDDWTDKEREQFKHYLRPVASK